MKHNRTGKFIAAGAATLLVTATISCNKESTTEAPGTVYDFETYVGCATYSLVGSAKALDQDSDVLYSDSVSLIMPRILAGCDVTELRDSILSMALQVKGKPVEQAISLWLDDMAKQQEYTPKKLNDKWDVNAQGLDIVTGYVANLNPRSLVYCIYCEGYMPRAAHGMYARRYINYSLADKGSIITLDKIFTAEGLKELPARIAAQAESMSDNIGATTITELPAGGNFFLSSEDEIVFCYQPYEVASYAQGIINIPLYPYELAEYMTPYGIALFQLQDLNEQ